jgi:hypothetical protein
VRVFGTCGGESLFTARGEEREALVRTYYGARTANTMREKTEM